MQADNECVSGEKLIPTITFTVTESIDTRKGVVKDLNCGNLFKGKRKRVLKQSFSCALVGSRRNQSLFVSDLMASELLGGPHLGFCSIFTPGSG